VSSDETTAVESVKDQYPDLIKRINDLYIRSYSTYGRAVDRAIEIMREAGIQSALETQAILRASLYNQEGSGSVAKMIITGTPWPPHAPINNTQVDDDNSDRLLPVGEQSCLVFAARYAHNRSTGAAMIVVNTILANWDFLSPETQMQIKREAGEATSNLDDWQKLKTAEVKEIKPFFNKLNPPRIRP